MVKGPFFGRFSPNLDLRRPKCRENYKRPRFGPLFRGKKNWPTFWAHREARFAICPFFYEKIFFRPDLFFGRLERPKRPPNAPGLASVPAAVFWQHYFHRRPPDCAAGSEVPGSAGALARFGAHSPPTRHGSCFMPRGTARTHLTTDTAILPTPRPLPSIEPGRTRMGDTVPISFSVVLGEPSD